MKTEIIDIHTHGIGGYETRDATPQDILRIAEIQGVHGVDAIIPAIYPASMEQMRIDIAAVKKAMEYQRDSNAATDRRDGVLQSGTENHSPATILGAHLEGPFLNPARAGALEKTSFLPARIALCKQLIEGFGDIVKIITIAPELDGAVGLIKAISDMGIIVSMGHSEATFAEAESGFNAGARGITHLFNAMRGIHHREPGIAGFGLINPHVFIEIIADPFHLHPKTIELIFGAKDHKKIIIVSDSVKAVKTNDVAQVITGTSGKLEGGSMTITASARRLTDLGFSKETVDHCIGANPAKYLAP